MLKLKTSYSTETGELTVRFPKRVRALATQAGNVSINITGEISGDAAGELTVYIETATAKETY